METVVIKKRHIQNYLGYRNIWPVRETDDGRAIYLKSPKLLNALDSYDIEMYCFKRGK